ncbi:MAG: hypothetical protein ACRDZ8_15030 [Acidimicrobiales bacterium]
MAHDTSVASAGGQPPAGAPGGNSAGARVYLRAQSRRGFVTGVVAPLCKDLADSGLARGIHLSSGWRFGSHLDLGAQPASQAPLDWAAMARSLSAGAESHLPATDESDADYLKMARMLGRIEEVPPPYLPRRPHGDTELLPEATAPMELLLQTGRAHQLAPLLEAAAAGSGGTLLSRVAEAFLALAASHPHGVRFGTFSLRSHAEAFFHWAGPAADYRSQFEDRMGRDVAVLQELVRRARDGVPSDAAARWAQAFRACRASFEGRVCDADLDRASGQAPAAPSGAGRSAFHQAVAASGVIDRTPPWFAGFRLTINVFYQLLPVLDVSPVQRFYLCYALAETVDAVYRESWQERLAGVAALMAAAR